MRAYYGSGVGKLYEFLTPSSEGKPILLAFGAFEEVIDGPAVFSPSERRGDECGSEEGFEEGEDVGYDCYYGIHLREAELYKSVRHWMGDCGR